MARKVDDRLSERTGASAVVRRVDDRLSERTGALGVMIFCNCLSDSLGFWLKRRLQLKGLAQDLYRVSGDTVEGFGFRDWGVEEALGPICVVSWPLYVGEKAFSR